MKLPKEIIFIILSYLNDIDILHLCISKLFLPTILTMPCYVKKLDTYLTHLLCCSFMQHDDIRTSCSIIPCTFDSEFYFALDTDKLLYFTEASFDNNLIINLFENILNVYSHIFQPFMYFKACGQPILPKRLQLFCSNLCTCSVFEFVPFSENTHNVTKYSRKEYALFDYIEYLTHDSPFPYF